MKRPSVQHENGALVWAQVRGYPWWPAVVLSRQVKKNTYNYRLKFIGENTSADLPASKVAAFQGNFTKYSKKKDPELQKAIQIAQAWPSEDSKEAPPGLFIENLKKQQQEESTEAKQGKSKTRSARKTSKSPAKTTSKPRGKRKQNPEKTITNKDQQPASANKNKRKNGSTHDNGSCAKTSLHENEEKQLPTLSGKVTRSRTRAAEKSNANPEEQVPPTKPRARSRKATPKKESVSRASSKKNSKKVRKEMKATKNQIADERAAEQHEQSEISQLPITDRMAEIQRTARSLLHEFIQLARVQETISDSTKFVSELRQFILGLELENLTESVSLCRETTKRLKALHLLMHNSRSKLETQGKDLLSALGTLCTKLKRQILFWAFDTTDTLDELLDETDTLRKLQKFEPILVKLEESEDTLNPKKERADLPNGETILILDDDDALDNYLPKLELKESLENDSKILNSPSSGKDTPKFGNLANRVQRGLQERDPNIPQSNQNDDKLTYTMRKRAAAKLVLHLQHHYGTLEEAQEDVKIFERFAVKNFGDSCRRYKAAITAFFYLIKKKELAIKSFKNERRLDILLKINNEMKRMASEAMR